MRVGAAVGQGDELGEGVGPLGAPEEGGGAVLGRGEGGEGEVGAAEEEEGGGIVEEGHAGCAVVCLFCLFCLFGRLVVLWWGFELLVQKMVEMFVTKIPSLQIETKNQKQPPQTPPHLTHNQSNNQSHQTLTPRSSQISFPLPPYLPHTLNPLSPRPLKTLPLRSQIQP